MVVFVVEGVIVIAIVVEVKVADVIVIVKTN